MIPGSVQCLYCKFARSAHAVGVREPFLVVIFNIDRHYARSVHLDTSVLVQTRWCGDGSMASGAVLKLFNPLPIIYMPPPIEKRKPPSFLLPTLPPCTY